MRRASWQTKEQPCAYFPIPLLKVPDDMNMMFGWSSENEVTGQLHIWLGDENDLKWFKWFKSNHQIFKSNQIKSSKFLKVLNQIKSAGLKNGDWIDLNQITIWFVPMDRFGKMDFIVMFSNVNGDIKLWSNAKKYMLKMYLKQETEIIYGSILNRIMI